MKYAPLGDTGIKVSRLCLGTMNFGEQNTEAEAREQLDYALAQGINFIDTAELYPVAPRAETCGRTEEFIGRWLKGRGDRDKIVLATKVVGRSTWLPWIREGRARLNRANIEAALNGSLKHLQTDYVDLYLLHWPDRKTNFFGRLGYTPEDDSDATPLEETLSVLGDCVKSGKVRHIGVCNDTPWGVMKLLEIAGRTGGPRLVTVQNPYNLLNRTFEIGLAEVAHREKVGLMAYSPLGFGVLSGKYIGGARPAGARLTLFDQFKRYLTPAGLAATEAYAALAKKYDLTLAQMAIAYVNSRPFLTSTIIGATKMEQLKANVATIDMTLPAELLNEIEAVHTRHPNPCP